MLIRPPVVRQMRQDLWVKMTAKPPPAAPASPPPAHQPATADVTLARLKELGELRDSGVLTEEEFTQAKAKLLA
jgi:hypothetical protein